MSSKDNPYISVVIPSYDADKINYLQDSIDSVLNQTYTDFEIIVITEGNELTHKINSIYGDNKKISINKIVNKNGGVAYARNKGLEMSNGEIVAYLDSDAVARKDWLKNMSEIYGNNEDILSVGGLSVANWIGEKPKYLPPEFYWLVGVTHDGHPKDGSYIRSAFGCNLSYKKSIFKNMNAFNVNFGKDHGYNLQGEEPELGSRIINEYGAGMYYSEDIVVYHAVEPYQCDFNWLSKRAYLQGITKAKLKKETPDVELNTEGRYLKQLYLKSIPDYLMKIIRDRDVIESSYNIFGIIYFTILVFIGYIIGNIKNI